MLHKICLGYAWDIPDNGYIYAWDECNWGMSEVCMPNMIKICFGFAWDIPETCVRHADLPEMPEIRMLRFKWNFHYICLR